MNQWAKEGGYFRECDFFSPSRWHLSQVSLCFLTPAGQLNTNADLESAVASGWPQSLGKNINPSLQKWLTFSVACLWTNRWRLSGYPKPSQPIKAHFWADVILKMQRNTFSIEFQANTSSTYFILTYINHLKTKNTKLAVKQLNPHCSFCNTWVIESSKWPNSHARFWRVLPLLRHSPPRQNRPQKSSFSA